MKCRDQTTAPAPVGGARTSNKGSRYRRNRSASRPNLKRRRPRSPAKPPPSYQPAPRGREASSPGCRLACIRTFVALFVHCDDRKAIKSRAKAGLLRPGSSSERTGSRSYGLCLSGSRRSWRKSRWIHRPTAGERLLLCPQSGTSLVVLETLDQHPHLSGSSSEARLSLWNYCIS